MTKRSGMLDIYSRADTHTMGHITAQTCNKQFSEIGETTLRSVISLQCPPSLVHSSVSHFDGELDYTRRRKFIRR